MLSPRLFLPWFRRSSSSFILARPVLSIGLARRADLSLKVSTVAGPGLSTVPPSFPDALDPGFPREPGMSFANFFALPRLIASVKVRI